MKASRRLATRLLTLAAASSLLPSLATAQVTPSGDLQHRCERFSPKRIANRAVLTARRFEAATPDRRDRVC